MRKASALATKLNLDTSDPRLHASAWLLRQITKTPRAESKTPCAEVDRLAERPIMVHTRPGFRRYSTVKLGGQGSGQLISLLTIPCGI